MQATESAVLLQNFVSLTEEFSRLGPRLSQAANALQATGMPPAKTLIDELSASRKSFTELCAHGVALAGVLALSPAPKPEALVSLSDLQSLLQTLNQAEEKRKVSKELSQRALALLDRLYALQHREREVFVPLAECQMRATVLRTAIAETPWPQLHPSVEELAKDDNPFVVLLALVTHGEALADETCVKFQDLIERAFSKALAVAALRGKLTFLSDAEPIPARQTVKPPPSLQIRERNGTQDGSKNPSLEATQKGMSATVAAEVTKEKQPPVFSEVRKGQPESKPEVPPARSSSGLASPEVRGETTPLAFVETQEVVKGVTVELPPSRGIEQLRTTPDVRAVNEPPPAISPSTVDDSVLLVTKTNSDISVSNDSPVLPPSVAAGVGNSMSDTKGEGIVDVFYRFEVEDKAQKIANMLLTGAYGLVEEKPAFLRDLVWRLIFEEKFGHAFHVARCLEAQHPDFYPRLPSWLLRTILLGQRVRNPQGDIARLLKDDFARCDADCRTTGDKEWDLAVEFLLLAGAFLPALIAPESRASTILHGVCLGAGLENFSAYCNVLALYSDLQIPLDPSLLKKPSRAQTKESGGFMRRLIGTQESGGRKDVVSEQAEPLRIEVVNRQNGVLDELNVLKNASASLPLLAGLACCRRAIENVGLLFDPEAAFSVDEPLPRPLLNADLSRIPTLVLNKQGEVEGVDQPAFMESVLRLVASGSLKML